MFRNSLGAIIFATALAPSQSAVAETRIGIGLGALYNGIGFNFSKSSTKGLAFGSVGCLGFSSSSGMSESDGVVTVEPESTETNCGVGFGFLSVEPFSSSKHAIGASLGLSYNTGTNDTSGIEWSLTPNYVYFLNGVENRGLNLGVGGVLTYRDSGFDSPGVLFNFGFHF